MCRLSCFYTDDIDKIDFISAFEEFIIKEENSHDRRDIMEAGRQDQRNRHVFIIQRNLDFTPYEAQSLKTFI